MMSQYEIVMSCRAPSVNLVRAVFFHHLLFLQSAHRRAVDWYSHYLFLEVCILLPLH